MTKLTITLNDIRKQGSFVAVWKNLLEHLKKTEADDEPLPIRTILESTGLDDALWCLRALPDEMDNAVRLLVCDIVEPAMVYVPAEEARPQAAIDAARAYARGEISVDDLAAARAAARDAARDAAWVAAAQDAALGAALGAAQDAAVAAAQDAALGAAQDAALGAAWAAARAAARAAAWAAAQDAARASAWAAARDAALGAGVAAARAAAWAAAQDAARAAAWAAAWAAAQGAGVAAARAEQEQIFVAWLDKMEVADEVVAD